MDGANFLKVAAQDSFMLILCFLLAVGLSWWPGNLLVRMIYSHVLDIVRAPDAGKSMKEWLQERALEKDMADFRSDMSAIIGRLERIGYISAIVFSIPALITAIIILKAFFAWSESKDSLGAATASQASSKPAYLATLAHYQTYVFGNLISLLFGVFLGLAALFLFPKWIAALGVSCKFLCTLGNA